VHLLLSLYISAAAFQHQLLVQPLSIRFLKLWFSCVTAVSRYFYHRLVSWYDCYLSSISYCRYNPFVLYYLDCTESMYRRDTHNLRVLAIGRPKPILVALHISYGRSILSFLILIHILLSVDLSTEKSAIYLSVPYP
jgi:hypothetical protein